MNEELPTSAADALRSIGTRQAPTIRPERRSSREIMDEIKSGQEHTTIESSPNRIDVIQTVRQGWRTSEFWVAIVGGVAGAVAVAKGWISETALADMTQNLGAPYILGRSLYKFAPSLLERLKK